MNTEKPEAHSLTDAAQRAAAKGMDPVIKDALTKWDPKKEMTGPPAPRTRGKKFTEGKAYEGNLSKTLFYTVKQHGPVNFEQLFLRMVDQGYETQRNSMGPLLTLMSRQGMIARSDDGMYSAMQAEYEPLKGRGSGNPEHGKRGAKAAAKKRVAKVVAKKAAKKAPAKKPAPAKKATAKKVARVPAKKVKTETRAKAKAKDAPATVPFTISDATLPLLIEHMTLKQLRATYAMLHKMFS